jgi:hypothetical protein
MGRRNGLLAFAAALLLACSDMACAPSGLYPAQGKLVYKGQPAAGARVRLCPEGPDVERALVPAGVVDKDGTFVLGVREKGRGVTPGRYALLVNWPLEAPVQPPPKPAGGKLVTRSRKRPQPERDRFNNRYNVATAPQFRVEIKPGSNDLGTFELKDLAASATQAAVSAVVND